MNTKDEALEQALDALRRIAGDDLRKWEKVADPGSIAWHVIKAITACREALAQKDEQEPVAEITADDMGRPFNAIRIGAHFYKEIPPVGTKLYTAPPRREALTDAELVAMWKRFAPIIGGPIGFARAVEIWHGIGGDE